MFTIPVHRSKAGGKSEEGVIHNINLILSLGLVGRVLEFLKGLAGRFNLSLSVKRTLSSVRGSVW